MAGFLIFLSFDIESDFEFAPASIPHLLPDHTEGKGAASEHWRVQPKQGGFLREKKVPWQMFHSQETPFDFNVLLHSYFKCPDVRRCQVSPQQQKVNPSKRKKFLTTNGM